MSASFTYSIKKKNGYRSTMTGHLRSPEQHGVVTAALDGQLSDDCDLLIVAQDLLEALGPFAKLALSITAEAPQDADYVSLWIDCKGISHRVTMDELRAASSAIAKATGSVLDAGNAA